MDKQHAKIVAVVTTHPGKIQGGGAPVFIAQDHQELQTIGMTIEKIMDSTAHEVDQETLIIVAR